MSTSRNYFQYLQRAFQIKPSELRPALLSFLYFFTLLTGYYILRPLRDEMGIAAGVDNMHWLFTGTFVAMLLVVPVFGYIAKNYARAKFLPGLYLFFIGNIIIYFFLFQSKIETQITAIAFFIWLSVFNMFVISIFWSFMTDLFSHTQSKRLFGFIAAGGSAGAILGPIITAFFAAFMEPTSLLPLSAAILLISTGCVIKLSQWLKGNASNTIHSIQKPIGGSIWAGFKAIFRSRYLAGISLFIILYTTVSTFLYFEQAHIVDRADLNPQQRTQLFAGIDLATNVLAVTAQLLVTSRLLQRFGLAISLAVVPLLVTLGFFSVSLATLLPIIVVTQIIHRAGNFSILRPGKEILFTGLGVEQRYKAKNFIDTAIYRGSDALTGWVFAGLLSMGLGLSVMALLAVPIAAAWALTGYTLGKKQQDFQQHGFTGSTLYQEKVIT